MQRHLLPAAFERRALLDKRARADLRGLLAVDLDREDAIQQQVKLVAGSALLDQFLPLPRASAPA